MLARSPGQLKFTMKTRRLFVFAIVAVFVWTGSSSAALSKFQGDATGGPVSVLSPNFTATRALRTCPSATVYVYNSGTSVLATIYSDTSGTPKSNPFTADTRGRFSFYGDSATYNLRISGGSNSCSDYTWSDWGGGSGTAASLGFVRVSTYATRGDGAVEAITGTGTVSVVNGSATVNGNGTAFTSQLAEGDILKINGVDTLLVRSISSDTVLTLHKVYSGATGSFAFTFRRPWSGWDSEMPLASDLSYFYESGWFATDQVNMRGKTRFRMFGAGMTATQIVCTGSGPAFNFGADAPTTHSVYLEQMTIRGTGDCTRGIEWESVHDSHINYVKVIDVTDRKIFMDFGVNNTIQSPYLSGLSGDESIPAAYGIYVDCLDPANYASTTLKIYGGHITHTTNTAFYATHLETATLIGLVIEGNSGKGLEATSSCAKFTTLDLHLEANTGSDLILAGGYEHRFVNTFCDGSIAWGGESGSISGTIQTLTLTGNFNTYDLVYNLTGAGSFTDSGIGNSGLTRTASMLGTTTSNTRRFNGNILLRTDNGVDGAGSDPGYTEFGGQRYKLIGTTPQNLSSTVYPTGKPWRVLFTGYFQDIFTGPSLAMTPLVREVTSASPSFVVGTRTITVSQSGGGVMQIASDLASSVGFAGTVNIVVGNYATGLASTSIVTPGLIRSGGAQWDPVLFAALGTPPDGTFYYCPDCTVANPCAGGGTGAQAKRLNGAWRCN